MVIKPLYSESQMTGKHVVLVEEAYKGGYRTHREALLVKIEGREGTFYVANGLSDIPRKVVECTRPIRAAYARINGLKVADIERAHAEWKHSRNSQQRKDAIALVLRDMRRLGLTLEDLK